jgi:outer membrane lipoprotein SlyB
MKHRMITLATLAVLAAPVYAGDIDGGAVIGGAIGGGAGAAVGSAIGGKQGAIIGGAVGGGAGAAIGSSTTQQKTVVKEKVIYVEDDHHDNGRHLGHYKNKKRGKGDD